MYTDANFYDRDEANYSADYRRLLVSPRYEFGLSDPAPISFVMTIFQLENIWETEGVQGVENYVNNRLYDLGARYPGSVHAWKYINGDVRYTFQPERPSGRHGR
jgi:hypothetical protein